MPSAPPTEPPAAKDAKAKVCAREAGGNAFARIPSYTPIISFLHPSKAEITTHGRRDSRSAADALEAAEDSEGELVLGKAAREGEGGEEGAAGEEDAFTAVRVCDVAEDEEEAAGEYAETSHSAPPRARAARPRRRRRRGIRGGSLGGGGGRSVHEGGDKEEEEVESATHHGPA
ncbi:hypothetical protein C8R44DRAFT_754692 [Mycena epipterygia]|nr:hypothetical protein C8R44DRAFT_754692 [Mycena epipterygia]